MNDSAPNRWNGTPMPVDHMERALSLLTSYAAYRERIEARNRKKQK